MLPHRGYSQTRHRIQVSHIAGGFFTILATREAQEHAPVFWPGEFHCIVHGVAESDTTEHLSFSLYFHLNQDLVKAQTSHRVNLSLFPSPHQSSSALPLALPNLGFLGSPLTCTLLNGLPSLPSCHGGDSAPILRTETPLCWGTTWVSTSSVPSSAAPFPLPFPPLDTGVLQDSILALFGFLFLFLAGVTLPRFYL